MFCSVCKEVRNYFKINFPLQVFEMHHKSIPAWRVFLRMRGRNIKNTVMIRLVSWVFMVVGHWLLFSPIIDLMGAIPLVGSLLAAAVAWVALIFSLVWGTLLHLLVMIVAWLFHRPIFSLILMAGVIACLIVIFSPAP